MEGWQEEVGRSKGRSVIGRIEHGTWLNAKIGSNHNPDETRAHVRQVFRCERIWRTFADGKAKDGFGRCTQRRCDEMGAGRTAQPRREVRRLQVRIAKTVTPRYAVGGPNKGILLECLSRMMGNYHVRF